MSAYGRTRIEPVAPHMSAFDPKRTWLWASTVPASTAFAKSNQLTNQITYALHAIRIAPTTLVIITLIEESVARRCHSHRLRLAANVCICLAQISDDAPAMKNKMPKTNSLLIFYGSSACVARATFDAALLPCFI